MFLVEYMQILAVIIPLTVLNIILPTVDVVTDGILIYKLFNGGWRCKYSEDQLRCREDPVTYCTSSEVNKDVCFEIISGYSCVEPDVSKYKDCYEDPN